MCGIIPSLPLTTLWCSACQSTAITLPYFILSLFIFPYTQVSLLATENCHAFVSVHATG